MKDDCFRPRGLSQFSSQINSVSPSRFWAHLWRLLLAFWSREWREAASELAVCAAVLEISFFFWSCLMRDGWLQGAESRQLSFSTFSFFPFAWPACLPACLQQRSTTSDCAIALSATTTELCLGDNDASSILHFSSFCFGNRTYRVEATRWLRAKRRAFCETLLQVELVFDQDPAATILHDDASKSKKRSKGSTAKPPARREATDLDARVYAVSLANSGSEDDEIDQQSQLSGFAFVPGTRSLPLLAVR